MTAPAADPALLDEAVGLARLAGELTLGWFDRPDLAVAQKSDGTPVTEADRAAERLIREHLARDHGNDTIIGEEEADVSGTSGLSWIIDPIDGTAAFTRGVPLYSNLLAVLDEHGPVLGVINLPALGTTVYAGRGLGCFRDGRPVHVSDRQTPDDVVLSTSSYSWWPEPALLGVKRAGYQLRTWGDGYGYAMVAIGAIEVMVDPEVSLWDIAPMPVILGEAGGRVTTRRRQRTGPHPGRAGVVPGHERARPRRGRRGPGHSGRVTTLLRRLAAAAAVLLVASAAMAGIAAAHASLLSTTPADGQSVSTDPGAGDRDVLRTGVGRRRRTLGPESSGRAGRGRFEHCRRGRHDGVGAAPS